MMIGGVAGFLLSLPAYIKQRSKLIVVVSTVTTGGFFGLLMVIGTIVGKLDNDPTMPAQLDLLQFKNELGEVGHSTVPFWLHATEHSG